MAPVACHMADAKGLPVRPDRLLEDGDTIAFGEIELNVIHTPGHTPGSICLFVETYLISGDTIFPGGPGKTGSPASFKQIMQSITEKIIPLPDETHIYPGHGDSTILVNEKREIQAFSSRPHPQGLFGDVLWLSS